MALTVAEPASQAEKRLVNPVRVELALCVDESAARRLVDIATSIIERHCSRTFALETVTEKIAGRGTNVLRLQRFPVVEITEFQNFVEDSDYYLDAEKGWLIKASGTWSEIPNVFNLIQPVCVPAAYPASNYTITYKAGYSQDNMPMDLQDACTALCKSLSNYDIDRLLGSQTIGDWSYTLSAGAFGVAKGLGSFAAILQGLNHYRVLA